MSSVKNVLDRHSAEIELIKQRLDVLEGGAQKPKKAAASREIPQPDGEK